MKKSNTLNDYSVSKILRSENRSNDYLELMISNISLEELIALKLEVASRSFGIPIYGFPIWSSITFIIKDALVKYAFLITGSHNKAAKFLGITSDNLRKYMIGNNITATLDKSKKE